MSKLTPKRKPKKLRKLENQQYRAAQAVADATDGGMGELEHHVRMRNDALPKKKSR